MKILGIDAPSLPGPQSFLVIGGPLLLWFAGIVLFWWRVFLVQNNKQLEQLAEGPAAGVPGVQSLISWNTLHQAMATSGGDGAARMRRRLIWRPWGYRLPWCRD